MPVILNAKRDISRSQNWLAGYRFTVADGPEPVTGALVQIGPVKNDQIHLRGVFETRERALRAALDYVGMPCKILSVRPWGENIERLVVVAHADASRFAEAEVSVAASRTARGVFVAA